MTALTRVGWLRRRRGDALKRFDWPRRRARRDAGSRSIARSALQVGAGGAAGAGLMYLLDPDRGRRRRAMALDRAAAGARRAFRRVRGYGRLAGAEAYGLSQRVTHLHLRERPAPSDTALADRVRTDAFRDRDLPAGRVNVNVEDGTVVLRGTLDHPEQIRAVEAAVREVEGVHKVESYLHLPHTPAPNKQDAIEAS